MVKWKMVRLGDVLKYEQPTRYIVENTMYDDSYDTPVLTPGQTFILGYTNEKKNIYCDDLPVIIFDDFTTAIKYVDFPFKVKSSAMKILKANSNANIKFLFYYMSTIKADTELHKRYWISHYSNMKITLPPLPIQKKIAEILDHVKTIIEKRKEQISKLDLLVKSHFVGMFGDPVTNPMGWEIKRLAQIADSRLGKMLDAKKQTGKNCYPYLANFNIQWFRLELKRLNEMDFNEADRSEFALEYGDLLVCEGGEVGRTAIWKNERENCFFQKAIHRVRCHKDICVPEYLAWVFYLKASITNFEGLVTSATISHLTGEKLKQLLLQVPPLTLQNRFAAFVQQVDKTKFVLQKGLEKLELCYTMET
jgi:type I restriction enzyme S subunit